MSNPVLLTKDDPVRGIGQLLNCLHKANGNLGNALQIAEDRYKRNPFVANAVKQLQQKAAVGAGTTAQTGWATELAPYGLPHEAYLLWQAQSILGRVSPLMSRVPWRLPTPKETGAGATAAWRGESLGAIVAKTVFDTFRVDYREAVIISALSSELFTLGATAELALTKHALEAVTTFTDTQFLDPAITATSTRPASVTNGAQPVGSTGSTAAQISADLATMIFAIQTPGDGLVWIMRPLTYLTIAARFAGAGMPLTPGFLLTRPVILGSKSPKQITLLDAANIAYASDDTIALDLSTEAALQMDSAPTQSGVAGTGSAMVSLYQTGLVGIRAELAASWQTIRYSASSPSVNAGCTYMTVTY